MQETINIENIWIKVYGKLFGYISQHAIDKDDVNDIIQDTFLKVKTNINSLRNPVKVESWIFQIARNTMNDHFREKKKFLITEKNTNEVSIEPNTFAEEDTKIKTQTQEFSEYAGFIVSELPEKYRKAVYMANIEAEKLSKHSF